MENDQKIKLNIGCGGRPLEGYINIDQDNVDAMKKRYPGRDFSNVKVFDYDIFNLPFKDGEVSEIRADSLVEHLSFIEERKFFCEVKRVLATGGLFYFETPNFEKVVKIWLAAEDNWKDFYRDDQKSIEEQHWFGNNSYSTDNRWGYLSAIIYGSQNGNGQYHKNCYTIPKIKGILAYLGMEEVEISEFLWKGDRDPMIRVVAKKM